MLTARVCVRIVVCRLTSVRAISSARLCATPPREAMYSLSASWRVPVIAAACAAVSTSTAMSSGIDVISFAPSIDRSRIAIATASRV